MCLYNQTRGKKSLIKILHVINWFKRGGVETQLLQILRDYDRSYFHMDVCCFGNEVGYLSSEAKQFNADILHCRKSVELFSFSKRFGEIIANREYDIVHCHSEAWCGPVLRGADLVGVPVRIAHLRSSLPQGFTIQNPILRLLRNLIVIWGRYWLIKYATNILSVSRAALVTRLPRMRNSDCSSIWTLGVDTLKFCPADDKADDVTSGPVIINVGSFIPQRRQDLVIRIFEYLTKRLPEARLLLVGEGERLRACMALAGNLGLSERVDFLGLREDISELLQNASIFVSCSEAEGLPNVLLEAQASGLPVVASDIPAHREVLNELVHGFLFKRGEIESAGKSVIRLFKEKQLYIKSREAGLAYVSRYYDSRKNLTKLQEMYVKWIEARASLLSCQWE